MSLSRHMMNQEIKAFLETSQQPQLLLLRKKINKREYALFICTEWAPDWLEL